MSFKKVAFLTTFAADTPDPEPEKASVYQKKKPTKVPSAAWMHMSTLSCRDFTKNTYNYRDMHFSLADEGITYSLPPHLSQVYKKTDNFQKTEFRKLPLKPGKFSSDKRKVFRNMSESSMKAYTLTSS